MQASMKPRNLTSLTDPI